MRIFLMIYFLVATSASAADLLIGADEFETLVTGKTLEYSSAGQPFGAEEYLEGRQVRWSFSGGECQDGEWYADGTQICFIYENVDGPQCWQFYLRGEQLLARYRDDPMATELYETRRMREPLFCPGPRIGV